MSHKYDLLWYHFEINNYSSACQHQNRLNLATFHYWGPQIISPKYGCRMGYPLILVEFSSLKHIFSFMSFMWSKQILKQFLMLKTEWAMHFSMLSTILLILSSKSILIFLYFKWWFHNISFLLKKFHSLSLLLTLYHFTLEYITLQTLFYVISTSASRSCQTSKDHIFLQFSLFYCPHDIVFCLVGNFSNWTDQFDQILISTYLTTANNFGSTKFVFYFHTCGPSTFDFMNSLSSLDFYLCPCTMSQ